MLLSVNCQSLVRSILKSCGIHSKLSTWLSAAHKLQNYHLFLWPRPHSGSHRYYVNVWHVNDWSLLKGQPW
jgi:hypothetical protein